MAKLTEDLMKEALRTHLHDGETLQNWAFGVKPPNMLLIIPLLALAIIPGVIASHMLSKNYVIGLTEKRLIVLQVKSITNAELKAVSEYSLEELKANPGSFKAGKIFTILTIEDAEKPFKAKFHRMFSKGNREHAVAIGEAISAS